MPWWRFWHKERARGERPEGVGATGPRAAASNVAIVRDAERRRLRRLLKREADLEFDVAQGHSALEPENRWTERVGQLDAAIRQAEADIAALERPPRERHTIELPETPIEVVEARPADPAAVTLRVGDVELRYQEEVDWAERGHQLALPQLARVAGDVDGLIPPGGDPEERARLAEHLRHAFSTIADEALERTVDGEPLPPRTLADLARPCPRCGGWLDPKGRCPACAERDWARQRIRADLLRLMKERDDVRAEMERYRERLPILERQLAETRAEIAGLREKGVEPDL